MSIPSDLQAARDKVLDAAADFSLAFKTNLGVYVAALTLVSYHEQMEMVLLRQSLEIPAPPV